jgi:SDR family mycofactocin-dependent oxidoreductase
VLEGKVAVITGGARGMGRSHALTLARAGADIAICDGSRHLQTVPYPLPGPEELEETAELIRATGRRCVAVEADVAKEADMARFAQAALDEFGRIDILLGNAGIFTGGVKAWELTEQQWDETFDVNIKGVWQACKAVIPTMREQGSGSIVLTSSMAGVSGMINFAHYVASKHGVIGLMRALAVELGNEGIRVNAVCPTGTSTDLLLNQFSYDLFAGVADGSGTRRHLEQGVTGQNLLPVGTIEAQDVSNAIRWLVSDEARYVTGLAMPIDAGALTEVFPVAAS